MNARPGPELGDPRPRTATATTTSTAGVASAGGRGGVVAIVAAMPEEMAEVRARTVPIEERRLGEREVRIGRLDGVPVALLVTGDGERNARRGLDDLLAHVEEWELERLIVIGTAGALSPDLAPTDLVVATHVVREPGDDQAAGAVMAAEPGWAARTTRLVGARPAVVVTARRIADSAPEKRRLLELAVRSTKARGGVDSAGGTASSPTAVVDLESAPFAELATAAGIPWLILRAVSDTAAEGLPELLNRARDGGGAVRRTRVLRGLLANPGAISQLLALRGRVVRCAEVLGPALRPGVLRGSDGAGMAIGTAEGS